MAVSPARGPESGTDPTSLEVPPRVPATRLRAAVYELPGQGTPNNNKTIGDFCCTGETATLSTTDGRAVGYVYVFGWPGQAVSVSGQTLVPGLAVLLSGSVNVTDPAARRDTSSVLFPAGDADPGAVRTADVGRLSYVITLTHANRQMLGGRWYIDLASAHVRVQGSLIP